MRYTLLVARREFVENAKTKGFWIGIFTLPLLFAIAIGVTGWLARSAPSRQFVLVDQSGAFTASIEQSIERAYQRSVLQALGRYVRQNLRVEQTERVDLSVVPADGGPPADEAAVETFIAAGGAEALLAQFRPFLAEGAPAFRAPSRTFTRVDLPEGIDAGANVDEIVTALRPYLTGDRLISVDGKEARLSAAVLIARSALVEITFGGGRGAGSEPAVQYWSTNLTAGALPNLVRNALNDEARPWRKFFMLRDYIAP